MAFTTKIGRILKLKRHYHVEIPPELYQNQAAMDRLLKQGPRLISRMWFCVVFSIGNLLVGGWSVVMITYFGHKPGLLDLINPIIGIVYGILYFRYRKRYFYWKLISEKIKEDLTKQLLNKETASSLYKSSKPHLN